VQIIGFDYGEVGIAQYPASLNTDVQIGWPAGVEPNSVMLKKHDIFMLEKLKPF
jgi:hypothetical protein